MKKEEQTTCTCNCNCNCNNEECVLKKVLIALAVGTVLGALIATGIFLIVRRTEQPRLQYCNGFVRCPHTMIRDDDYLDRYDAELDAFKENKAYKDSKKSN